MKELKIILIRAIAISVVSVLVTALIRSIVLSEWLFVGLYLFILLAFQSIEEVKKKIELQRKTEDLFSKMEGLKDIFEDFDDIENKDEEERNDDK